MRANHSHLSRRWRIPPAPSSGLAGKLGLQRPQNGEGRIGVDGLLGTGLALLELRLAVVAAGFAVLARPCGTPSRLGPFRGRCAALAAFTLGLLGVLGCGGSRRCGGRRFVLLPLGRWRKGPVSLGHQTSISISSGQAPDCAVPAIGGSRRRGFGTGPRAAGAGGDLRSGGSGRGLRLWPAPHRQQRHLCRWRGAAGCGFRDRAAAATGFFTVFFCIGSRGS